MSWDKDKPAGKDKLRDSDADIRGNFSELDTHRHEGTAPGGNVRRLNAGSGEPVKVILASGQKCVWYDHSGTVIGTIDEDGNLVLLGNITSNGSPSE